MMMRLLIFLFIGLSAGHAQAQTKKPAPPKPGGNAASAARGKAIYTTHCLACHQADGSGVPNLNPPLTVPEWVGGPKPVLIEMILKGSREKVEIDGDVFHNAMPPQPTLTDQQIADVLTYVRSSFGNKASAVTAAEVKTVRAKVK